MTATVVPSIAYAETGLVAEQDPSEIINGTPVAACGWPTVVELRESEFLHDDVGGCTGVWIGGRVVLTASHCVSLGFRVPTSRFCNTAADCPSYPEYDDVIDLECDGPYTCADDDLTLSSSIRYARFGQQYPDEFTDGHIRRAIPIAYCRRWNDDPEPDFNSDFAYCILAAEPDLQPIPVMMHCEADQYLDAETPVTAVGFGVNTMAGSGFGTKRFATSAIEDDDEGSGSDNLFFDPGSFVPGPPNEGDSGGPLFVRLPDNTWRVVGIAITSFVQYNTVWGRMDWLAEDPHVDLDAILPCHDVNGNWDPGPGCGGFPTNPGTGSGGWRLSPACAANVGGASQTCTMLASAEEPQLATPTVAPPSNEVGSSNVSGCRSASPPGLAAVLLGLCVIGWRRRRGNS